MFPDQECVSVIKPWAKVAVVAAILFPSSGLISGDTLSRSVAKQLSQKESRMFNPAFLSVILVVSGRRNG
jgi:hypothetical protein